MFVLGVGGGFCGVFWFGFVCLLDGLGLVLLLFVFFKLSSLCAGTRGAYLDGSVFSPRA